MLQEVLTVNSCRQIGKCMNFREKEKASKTIKSMFFGPVSKVSSQKSLSNFFEDKSEAT